MRSTVKNGLELRIPAAVVQMIISSQCSNAGRSKEKDSIRKELGVEEEFFSLREKEILA
jgi:hypothetical protein